MEDDRFARARWNAHVNSLPLWRRWAVRGLGAGRILFLALLALGCAFIVKMGVSGPEPDYIEIDAADY